ncbi:MAG: hypothetical protein L0154_22395 [Chloroflexi bacterium]|nr:hypothetical protein [Chloroflexota bacterium]
MNSWCRLYAILARCAPVGVIFRRGPSNWVKVIKWHTETDTFEHGQWFKGRIYERRGDVSPDGSLMVYFASKQSTAQFQGDYSYSWTAVSRPPYLTALALYPKGDTWNGGGLFEDNRTLWLNHPDHSSTPHPDHVPPKSFRVRNNIEIFGEDRSIVDKRLRRDGWTCKQPADIWPGGYVHKEGIWERDGLHMILQEIDFQAYAGPYIFHYAINDTSLGRCTWGDWDQQGRLVIAQEGKLWAVTVNDDVITKREIADFNDDEPQPIDSPEWARRWQPVRG